MASTKNNRNKLGNRKQSGKNKKVESSKESLLYEYRYEIGFVFVSAFSLLVFLSNLGMVGVVGKGIKALNFGLFGILAWFSPLFAFLATIFWIANRNNFKVKLKIWISSLLFLILSAIAALISYPNLTSLPFLRLYASSAEGKNGGGFFGGAIAKLLAGSMGTVGAYIILISIVVILFIFLTGRVFVNPIKRRAVETRDHLIDLKNEKMEEVRKKEEIKREVRKEERLLKKSERERLREEKIQRFQEVQFHSLQSLKEKQESKETEEVEVNEEGLLFQGERNNRELFERMEKQERLLREIREKEKGSALSEIGTTEKADLTTVLEPLAEEQEKEEEGIYKQLIESKFGKTLNETEGILPLKVTEKESHIGSEACGLSWKLVKEEKKVLFPMDEKTWNQTLSTEEETEENLEENLEESLEEKKVDLEEKEVYLEERPGEKVGLEEIEDFGQALQNEDEALISSNKSSFDGQDDGLQDEAIEYEEFLDTDDFNEAIVEELLKEAKEEEGALSEERVYVFPPLDLLQKPTSNQEGVSEEELFETADKLQKTLEAFGVKAKVTDVSCGPSVTRYELQPEIGVKVSRITSLSDDIKLNLAAADIRIEAPIPGKAAVGIEVPNKTNTMVSFRELIENKDFVENQSKLSFAVGKDIGGQTMVTDIAKMPHLLIAGATGSGKSVCMNTLIMSILYKARPDEVKLIMIDPKVVELSCYNGIPHLLLPVVTDPKKAAAALNWAVAEMNRRYTLFAEEGVRNIKGYNKAIGKENPNWMPQIVILVDELADLMMVSSKEVEEAICRLAQLARAAGIHLVIATQRPSVNVITGLIKANIPSRIAFAVSSQVDSRTILDGAGAEKLLGKGDMLFFPSGYPKPVRVQGAFVSDNEVADVVAFIKNQNGSEHKGEDITEAVNQVAAAESIKEIATKPQVEENDDYDEYFDEAGRFIIEKQKASIGMLQRVYRIGFNRAARIMDQLAEAGVVSEEDGTRARKILMTKEEFSTFLHFKNGDSESDSLMNEEEL